MIYLPKKYAEEIILVCDRRNFEPLVTDEGFLPCNKEIWEALSKNVFPMRRGDAEIDQSVIQLVSYFLVSHRGTFLTHKRCKKQPEKRLIDVRAIGFSGHINEADGRDLFIKDLFEPTGSFPYVNRELSEEVSLDLSSQNPISFHGYIWEPSDSMGRQHVGLMYEVPCNGDFKILEPGLISEAKFQTVEEIAKDLESYGSWSRIVLSAITDQKVLLRGVK